MNLNSGSWKQYLSRVAVLCGGITLAVFAGNRLANAGPGEPVRKSLTVAGTLTGVSGGTVTATFRFYRAMADSSPICAPEAAIRDGAERDAVTGAFSVEVPLTQSGHECPDTLFHDPSTFVEVSIAGSVVALRAAVNPVPYAVYAQQYGTPDCPIGYQTASIGTGTVLCARNSSDQMVRVGSGPTAFWIDRWESSVAASRDGLGVPYYGRSTSDYPIPANGQWSGTTPSMYAVSVPGVLPASYISWFQAMEACRASGKRLPTSEEWLTAARGTSDPTMGNDGTVNDLCNTNGPTNRTTNAGVRCVSAWGAQDMIGNVAEWTTEWASSLGGATSSDMITWPSSSFSGDMIYNVVSSSRTQYTSTPYVTRGLPSGTLRGGSFSGGVGTGVFSVSYVESVQWNGGDTGFRCVIPR